MLIVSFIRNIPKSQLNKNNINWICFINTVSEYISKMSNYAQVLTDNNGNLSQADRKSLHHIVMAFFLQGSMGYTKVKMFDLLKAAHIEIDNIERDTINMSIYGTSEATG